MIDTQPLLPTFSLMLRPGPLLVALLFLATAAVAALWFLAPEDFNKAPVTVKHAPIPEAEPMPVMVPNPLLPPPDKTGGTDSEKQIALLQNQVEYLHEQVQTLQKENSELIDKLAKLGMNPAATKPPMKREPAPDDVPVDYVTLGTELLSMRELAALPMPTVTAPLVDVEKVILAWLQRQHPPGYGEREGAAYAALGAIPRNIDTLPLRAALLVRQIGGWYDAESETIYLVDAADQVDGVPVIVDPVLALAQSNLLHHFGKSLLPGAKLPLTTDERMARLGLLGGDAVLLRFLRDLKQFQGPNPNEIPADDPDHPLNQVPMPAYLRELETFPQASGFHFAQAMHSLGGFKQLTSTYGRPPESTADVLDTERYLAEQRLPIPRIEWSSVEVANEKPFWDDRLGQSAVVSFLKRYNAQEIAVGAARGWQSDRFLAYDMNGDHTRRGHAVWQTRWSAPEQAADFLKALRECLTQFYDNPATENTFSAQGRTLHASVLADKHSVLLIDAATEDFAKAALKAFR